MKQTNAEMAAFLACYYKTGSRPWKELRASWNKEHPQWVVEDDSRLLYATTVAAWKRVTGRRFAFAETVQDKGHAMNGHVRKRGSKWEVMLELGEQAAQRCPVCVDRPRPRRAATGRTRAGWTPARRAAVELDGRDGAQADRAA